MRRINFQVFTDTIAWRPLALLIGLVLLAFYAIGGDMRPVILWTDALIFLLVTSLIGLVFYVRSREHLRAPWRQVFRRKLGMSAMVVLIFYVAIGLMDSLHYRPVLEHNNKGETIYAAEVLSLFDHLATPIRERVEKSYSSPFATRLHSKESVEQADGSTQRLYPRLKFGGAHLADPDQGRFSDVIAISVQALIKALLLWAFIGLLLVWSLTHNTTTSIRQQLGLMVRGQTDIPWRLTLITLGTMLTLSWIAWDLSHFYHIFGTDKVGQDVFYQSLKSIRTGLVIGTLTTLIMLPFAIILGIMAGYLRGWVDDVIQYLYTTLSSIPGVLLIAAAVLMMEVYMNNNPGLFETSTERADMRLLYLCLILGITSWTGLCRLLRGEALKLRELEYIQAAKAFGVGHAKIIGRHILPNVLHIVLIAVVLDFSGLVLAEAVLSYVGVGVDPTMNSWGNMINSARLEMARDPLVWWSLLAAFVFMFALVLAANLFSDAVRDAFDPRLRERHE